MRDSNVLIQVVLSSLSRADIAILSELKRKHPDLSRAALKVLFREKRVKLVTKLNGSVGSNGGSGDELGPPIRTLSPSDDLFPGTHLIEILDWNPSADLSPEPSHGPDTEHLPILFENEDLLILHKNSGTPSVPLKPFETKTAVSSAILHLKRSGQTSALKDFLEIGKASGHPLEAGLLHRLDTGTSGVLAFAKNLNEFDRIRSLWKTPQVRKFYRAIVQASHFEHQLPLRINTPIGHDPKSSKRMLVIQNPKDERTIRGKPLEAITHLLSAQPLSSSNQLLDLQIEIETGVMHQIRVHLASIGLPILGDPLYGNTNKSEETAEAHPQPASRLHLHHERLELPLRSGAILSVQAKPNFLANS